MIFTKNFLKTEKKNKIELLFKFSYSVISDNFLSFVINSFLAVIIAIINFNIGVVIKNNLIEKSEGITLFTKKYVFNPIFFGKKIFYKDNLSVWDFFFLIFLSILILKSFTSFFHRFLMNLSYETIEKKIKKELFTNFIRSNYQNGIKVDKTLISHFSSDIDTMVDHVWFIPNRLIYLITTIYYHVKYDFDFGSNTKNQRFKLILISLFLFLVFVWAISLKKITEIGVKIKKNLESDNKLIYERINNFEYIKTVSGENYEENKIKNKLDSTFAKNKKLIFITSLLKTIPSYLLLPNNPIFFILLIIKTTPKEQQKNSIFLLFNFARYYFTVQKLNTEINKILDAFVNLEELSSNLLIVKETLSSLDYHDFPKKTITNYHWKNDNIIFKKVFFAYPHRLEHNILNNFSFIFEKGESYGIIGKNGIGKSTIAKNILKLYKLKLGSIFIGNKDILEINTDLLHKKICYLTNRPSFFSLNIIDNVFYPENSQGKNLEKLEESARKVGIMDFIEKLPDGFETILNEGGSNLSEGQKQQISAMKIFIKDYDIFILDEILSNVHPNLKKIILKNIFEKIKGKTIIVIDHHYEIFRYVNFTYQFTGEKLIKLEKENIVQ